ncbi:hypothetical protein NIES2098_01440 [Calothrix sp. NIES-2098]|nr:hypothetical protein NIES2098_01440 [Calothrix sp. NIES-2098]
MQMVGAQYIVVPYTFVYWIFAREAIAYNIYIYIKNS